LSFNDLALIR